jgi:hypothetical protein
MEWDVFLHSPGQLVRMPSDTAVDAPVQTRKLDRAISLEWTIVAVHCNSPVLSVTSTQQDPMNYESASTVAKYFVWQYMGVFWFVMSHYILHSESFIWHLGDQRAQSI